MGILIGTDFNPKGVHGIGPKTGLKLVKKYESFEALLDDEKVEWESDNDPEEIKSFLMDPPVEDVENLEEDLDREKVRSILVDDHGFSEDRVASGLDDLEDALESRQSALRSFM